MYRIIKYKQKSYDVLFNLVVDYLNKKNDDMQFLHFHWSRWEWMFARDNLNEEELSQIVLIMDEEQLVGLITYEDEPGLWFFVYDDRLSLKQFMLTYFIEQHPNDDIMIPEDSEMIRLINEVGFKETDYIDPITKFNQKNLDVDLCEGYELVSLEEDYRPDQIHHVLYRGFNHGDNVDYSEENIQSRVHMTSSPNFKRSFTYVAKFQNIYVSYAGVWFKKNSLTALVEPVATVPEHRKHGLARACIKACIRKVIEEGAKEVFIGSNRDFYLNMGFETYSKAIRFTRKI